MGFITSFRLTELITDLEEILTNQVDLELISDLLEDVNILADLWPKLREGNTVGEYGSSR